MGFGRLIGYLGCAAAALLVAAGCGGTRGAATTVASSETSTAPFTTTAATATTVPSPDTAAARAEVARAWATFFDGSSAVSVRKGLVDNAPVFSAVLTRLANNPLAAKSDAVVSVVRITSADAARVTYTVRVAGAIVLKDAHGTAVHTSDGWKVSRASFCALLALVGETPSACAAN